MLARGLRMGLGLLAVWLGGFLVFLERVPVHPVAAPVPADGVVVLTGGADRLVGGLALLRDGKGRALLVSGVDPAISDAALIDAVAPEAADLFDCCVTLGRKAMDTRGNAEETAVWAYVNGYGSLHVVTAAYHMPRSLAELHRAMPDIRMIAHPVFPRTVRLEDWWHHPNTARLLHGEFAKYLVALARARMT